MVTIFIFDCVTLQTSHRYVYKENVIVTSTPPVACVAGVEGKGKRKTTARSLALSTACHAGYSTLGGVSGRVAKLTFDRLVNAD